MDYVSPVNELEQRLKEAGEHLAFPPSSTKNLLDLLDKTEHLLSFVGQAPSLSMQGALVPSMGALIADGLLKHSEIDVKIFVASCLCEVARITAPEPPYKDEIMKDIFQLIVLAFGQLSNVDGQSYHKAIHILESVAKVKSCLLILDLDCDALVLEMFEQFLSEISVKHPHSVFSDIEAIMTVIIEESDEIATELLSLLISHVKKENLGVTIASWKVAEKVLRNCIDTLKPYSETITKLVNSNLDDYAEVVTVLCQNAHENGHMVTRSTRTNSTHKRDRSTLENGGSVKKQKFNDKSPLKGKEVETPRRGRPKKNKNSLNQDNSPNSVQNSKEDTRKTRFHDKRQSSSLYNVVVKKEDVIISDHDDAEPLTQQTNNNKTQSRRKLSNKRLANGSHGKDTSKKWGQDLVGHRVKVWWPLDKMYYEGTVSSYNHVDNKHKVSYVDGDEEVLDLCSEKWEMLDDVSPDQQQEQVADLPSPVTSSAERPEQKRKRKRRLPSPVTSSAEQPEQKRKRTKSRPRVVMGLKAWGLHAGSSKTADVICNADNQKDDPVSTPADSSKTADVICSADNQKNTPVSTPADSSKTDDVICNVDIQMNDPVSTPADSSKTAYVIPPADSSKTEDVICNADNQKNDPLSTPADSSKTADVICNADNLKNIPVSTSADSSKTEDVNCNADNQKNIPVSTPADSSKTEDVNCNADNLKNDPVSSPADSSDVICNADIQKNDPVSAPADSSKTEDVICNADNETNTPEKNGDLQEEKPSESSETTQRLDNTDS
ncbi:putative sister chromatid cohesion protein Pds5 [Helianthus annuus]|nr:putative sister chromatid cohesion protein Pds5 [Helianthus annuus]